MYCVVYSKYLFYRHGGYCCASTFMSGIVISAGRWHNTRVHCPVEPKFHLDAKSPALKTSASVTRGHMLIKNNYRSHPLIHKRSHTAASAISSNLCFGIFPKDTLTCSL